jgi:hypothetical protein
MKGSRFAMVDAYITASAYANIIESHIVIGLGLVARIVILVS